MSKAQVVAGAVKQTLLGSSEPVQLSAQTKNRFRAHAVRDPETGEYYIGPDQFIDAITPPDEDYVSARSTCIPKATSGCVIASPWSSGVGCRSSLRQYPRSEREHSETAVF